MSKDTWLRCKDDKKSFARHLYDGLHNIATKKDTNDCNVNVAADVITYLTNYQGERSDLITELKSGRCRKNQYSSTIYDERKSAAESAFY